MTTDDNIIEEDPNVECLLNPVPVGVCLVAVPENGKPGVLVEVIDEKGITLRLVMQHQGGIEMLTDIFLMAADLLDRVEADGLEETIEYMKVTHAKEQQIFEKGV